MPIATFATIDITLPITQLIIKFIKFNYINQKYNHLANSVNK